MVLVIMLTGRLQVTWTMCGPAHRDIITFTPHIAQPKYLHCTTCTNVYKVVPTCLCVILDPVSHLLLANGIFFLITNQFIWSNHGL